MTPYYSDDVPESVTRALHLLVTAAHASGSSKLVEAAELVVCHFRSRLAPSDACNPHGIERP